jgi:hypothetical protein
MANSIPKRHPELVSGSHREPSLILLRGQMLKRVQHDITRSQSQQTKNKSFNKTFYEKQRNLETNHPNRNQYPFGHRHYAWIEFVPLSREPLSNE